MSSITINNRIYKVKLSEGFISAKELISESWMDEVLNKINTVFPISNFIDVGVNIGQTLLKVKSINPKINYFAFEPNPHCISHIFNLITLNKLQNVTVYPFALGRENKMAELKINAYIDSGGYLIDGFRDNALIQQPVAVLKFDDLCISEKFSKQSI